MNDHPERAVLDSVRRLVRALRTEAKGREGLSPARHFVLHLVAKEPGLSVNALAARCRTSQSSVSVALKPLLAEGLVKRRPAPEDRRRAVVEATAAGRRRLAGGPAPTQERLLAGLRRLPAVRRARLAADLQAWLRACGLESGPAPMIGER